MKRTILLMALIAAAAGCVERRLLIRSNPTNAPVWVNQEFVGRTPFDHDFAHYGVYGLRVGPIRDEQDELLREEVRTAYAARAPWFQTFPIDFFAEVLYPGTLRDVHRVPVVELPRSRGVPEEYRGEGTQDLMDRAESYRERALSPVPEQAAE